MLTSAQMKLFFKRLLLVLGLVMVFAAVIEQTADNYIYEPPTSSQVSFIQLDKDNHRDVGDAVSLFKICNENLIKNVKEKDLKPGSFGFMAMKYQQKQILSHTLAPKHQV